MMQTRNPTETAPSPPHPQSCGCECHCQAPTEFVPCVPGALPGGLSRTRFFDGMFLTQQDLEREQGYWLMKRRLTNRALGQGIVWGLRLHWDSTRRRFCLGPGYALDCCGNDLVVECPQEIDEQTLVNLSDPAVLALLAGETKPFARCPDPAKTGQPSKACIVLQYVECPGDPRPLHRDACHTEADGCAYSSVRETTRLLLVPPPAPAKPTPIECFCQRLEDLKSEAQKQGGAGTGLFDDPSPGPTLLPMVARLLATSGGNVQEMAVLRPDGVTGNLVTGTFTAPSGPGVTYQVSLEPNPGYVFHPGAANSPPVQPFGFDVDLDPGTPKALELQIASLWEGTPSRTVALNLDLTVAQDQATFVISTTKLSDEPVSPVCGDFLKGGFFLGDPRCVLKTLVLAIVTGWFHGEAPQSSDPAKKPWIDSRTALAWRIGRIMWRLLFGANLLDPQRGQLTGLLRHLFEEWCCGFVYPGPRCLDDHHGVYLGCVEISPKGKIVAFDPWEHRRHVLTGPLLTHWGGQFGLAPLDVTVSRLAQWICCVSATLSQATTAPDGVEEDFHAAIANGGAAVYAGPGWQQYLDTHGLTKTEEHEVSLGEFCRAVIQVLGRPESPMSAASQTGRAIYSVGDVHLLIPVSTGTQKLPAGSGARFAWLDRELGEVGPTGRAVARDFALQFAETTELSSLAAPESNPRFARFVDALKEAEVVSVADYLELGTEAAVNRVAPALLESGAFENTEDLYLTAEEIYKASEDLVLKALKPLKEQAIKSRRPFIRAHLGDPALLARMSKETAKSLKRRLSNDQLLSVARKVIEMGG